LNSKKKVMHKRKGKCSREKPLGRVIEWIKGVKTQEGKKFCREKHSEKGAITVEKSAPKKGGIDWGRKEGKNQERLSGGRREKTGEFVKEKIEQERLVSGQATKQQKNDHPILKKKSKASENRRQRAKSLREKFHSGGKKRRSP